MAAAARPSSALVFLGFQAYEFTEFVHEGLTLQRNLFGSTFFVLTASTAATSRWASLCC